MVWKIMHFIPHMFPYRCQGVQMMQAYDNQQGLDFAEEFLIRYDENDSWPWHILWMDESYFSLNSNINSKN